MITIEEVCAAVPGLAVHELRLWVEQDLVRPAAASGEPRFAAVDVARVRLIVDLRDSLEVEDRTVPLVLGLLDQLYTARAELRRVLGGLDDDARARLARHGDG